MLFHLFKKFTTKDLHEIQLELWSSTMAACQNHWGAVKPPDACLGPTLEIPMNSGMAWVLMGGGSICGQVPVRLAKKEVKKSRKLPEVWG